jgi:hypothetical protein
MRPSGDLQSAPRDAGERVAEVADEDDEPNVVGIEREFSRTMGDDRESRTVAASRLRPA